MNSPFCCFPTAEKSISGYLASPGNHSFKRVASELTKQTHHTKSSLFAGLSEILTIYRRGMVLCNLLQGYHLLKATGETAGCWQETQLVERQEIVVIAMP